MSLTSIPNPFLGFCSSVDPYSYTCNGTFSTLTLLTAFFTDAGVNVTDIVVSEACYGETVGEEYIFTDCGGEDAVSFLYLYCIT